MTDLTDVPRVVAIDGVLGSGKTTVARRVADRLGIEYLDTGAMYRCVALGSTRLGIDVEQAASGPGSERDAVISLARRLVIEVLRNADGSQVVRLDGSDVTTEIRTSENAKVSSLIATIPEVRVEMVDRQRVWARTRGAGVLEGRDIASAVFPDAPTKVFLTASVEERARRRHMEQPHLAFEEVVADLEWRDANDSTRAADPLRIVEGATVIDTTGLSIDDVVDRVVQLAQPAATQPVVTQPVVTQPAATQPAATQPVGTVAEPVVAPKATENSTSATTNDAQSVRLPLRPSRGQLAVFRATWLIVVPLIRSFFRVDYQGLQHVPKTGAFIVAPMHRSNVDFILLPRISKRRMRFLGKDSIWKWKFLASYWDALGGIPVHRGTTDRESMRICAAVLDAGEPLVVFPEGTRKEGPVIEELFDGAAYLASKHGVPILPIGIGGSAMAMPKGSKFPRPVKIRVVIGRPIPAPKGGRSATKAATAELRSELQRLFDDASTV